MTVGLPDAAVRESHERVRSALKNCGYDIPPTNIVINLALRQTSGGIPWLKAREKKYSGGMSKTGRKDDAVNF